MRSDILFFDFAFEEYLPTIEEATRRGFRAIMNQPAMQERLEEEGTSAAGFMDYAREGDAEYAIRSAKAMGQRFAAAISQPGAAGAFDSAGGNLLMSGGRDLVQSVLATAQNQFLISRVLGRLIETSSVGAVVMRTCRGGGHRIVETLARRSGIPVIHLGPDSSARLIETGARSHIAVAGSRHRDLLIDSGLDPELAHVTGAPQWDVLYQEARHQSKEEAREELGLPHDRTLIFYASGFASGGTLAFPEAALGLMKANKIFAQAVSSLVPPPLVATRPHPWESAEKPGRRPTAAELSDYRRWFVQEGVNLLHVDYSRSSVVREKAALIRAADVVVTSESSLITEVMILGRPCIVLNEQGSASESFYGPSDGVVEADGVVQLSRLLDRMLTDQGYTESLQQAADKALPTLNRENDGRSSVRLVDLIERIAITPPE